MILVDSSVLIDLFRGKDTPAVRRLAELEHQDVPFGVPLVCYQEVLQGAKDETEWKRLSDVLGSQRLVGPDDALTAYDGAARLFFDARRKGVTLRSSIDALIAQLALSRDDVLLHDDEDFELVKKVRPLKTLRS
jgi:predicted nucleic acid-binding protein